MSMPLARHYSVADVLTLPADGNRYETVHGELLVTPAPAGLHQLVVMRLIRAIDPYLMAHGLEALLTAPADITFDDDTLVQPDLFVADLREWIAVRQWEAIKTLHLTIEVLSPSTARADRLVKRRLYQEQHIPEYWMVDTDQRQIEVWTPEAAFPRIERERLVWRHPLLSEECVVDVGKLLTFPSS
jgi:Uma2 family endonuclease